MALNYQTKEKIDNVKKSVQAGEDLKEIIKKYFNSKNKKDQWLEKYWDNFNADELNFLEFETKNQKEIKEEKDPAKDIKEDFSSPSQIKENETLSTINQELSVYFKDSENMQILKQMIEEYKKRINEKDFVILEEGIIDFPSEVLLMKNTGTIGIKSNMEQYEQIKKIAVLNKVNLSVLVNFIFWDFLKKYK